MENAYKIIHSGEFLDIDSVKYRVDIERETDDEITSTDLDFPTDAVSIEWGEADKISPVRGSSATIKVVSTSDRRFINLFSVKRGTIRCRIYRNDALYWCGTLDGEQYEEPYSFGSGYDVTLTFSDFGALKFYDWNKSGLISVKDVIEHCIATARLDCLTLDLQSSTVPVDGGYSIFDCIVASDNFYDEDGEASTLYDVLNDTLQPFGLLIRQNNGKIGVYDLNSIFNTEAKNIYWTGDDAVLSVDKIYNKINLTFSPYAENPIADGELNPEEVLPDTETFDIRDSGDPTILFKVAIGDQEGLRLEKSAAAKYFRIDKYVSGEDCAGIALTWTEGELNTPSRPGTPTSPPGSGTHPQTSYDYITYGPKTADGMPISSASPFMRTPLGFIRSRYDDLQLVVYLDACCDYRIDPFDDDYKPRYETADYLNNNANVCVIPCSLNLLDDSGNVLWHYDNKGGLTEDRPGNMGNVGSIRWKEGAGNPGDFILTYYQTGSPKEQFAFKGWTTNRRHIFPKLGDNGGPDYDQGEPLPLPPVTGHLQLEVYPYIIAYRYDNTVTQVSDKLIWALFKNPRIEVRSTTGREYHPSDVAVSAWLEKDASEDRDLELRVGTELADRYPSGRGILMTPDRSAVGNFTRAGVSDTLERLLIGTIYSQYSSRHTLLSGSMKLIADDCVMTDDATEGKFYKISETQILREAESNVVVCELTAEEYEGLEIEKS